jgi:two-component system phosphate regulon response regulator PhoB
MRAVDTQVRPRVLVAEDDDSLRRLLELRLASDGFEVRDAADGVIALAIAEDWIPDAVVCDVMMPNLSGLSVCRELRARDATKAVPIILLTARFFDEDIQAVMTLGGVTYMPKPFDFTQLHDSLRTALGERDRETRGARTIRIAKKGKSH